MARATSKVGIGQGWHKQSLRHSNARRYGKASIRNLKVQKEHGLEVGYINPDAKINKEVDIVQMAKYSGFSAVKANPKNKDRPRVLAHGARNAEKMARTFAKRYRYVRILW